MQHLDAPVIDAFCGDHAFLSNFHPAVITLDGHTYPTVEHAFQAAKTPDPAWRELIRSAGTPGVAKRLGRRAPLRADWEPAKQEVMLRCLRAKFTQHPHLAALLAATGAARLVEGNTWGDTYWGVCNGRGQNHLGRLLMQVRSELRSARAAA